MKIDSNSLSYLIIITSITVLNFTVWMFIGKFGILRCLVSTKLRSTSISSDTIKCSPGSGSCNTVSERPHLISLETVSTTKTMEFRYPNLAIEDYPDYSLVANPYEKSNPECQTIIHTYASSANEGMSHDCTAVTFIDSSHAYHEIRYNAHWKLRRHLYATTRLDTAGYFKVSGHGKGRVKMMEKLGPFVQHLSEIENYILEQCVKRGLITQEDVLYYQKYFQSPLSSSTSNVEATEQDTTIKKRLLGDIIVMVVNEGELDLLANLACSCEQAGLSMKRMVVFTPSAHIIPYIESLGFLGLHHESFAYAPHKASAEYLDSTFVDMMWYKCFSVYVSIRLGFHVLFQDVDLVWFKDPFPYFQTIITQHHSQVKALFTDDGQRGVRYSPFYGNSGFYYLVTCPETLHFSWNILTLFDLLQRTGSHQNIIALRLMEMMDYTGLTPYILSPDDFPNGHTYHHKGKYMNKLRAYEIYPYNFHMCWTFNKTDKIDNFKSLDMWYLPDYPGQAIHTYTSAVTAHQSVSNTSTAAAAAAAVDGNSLNDNITIIEKKKDFICQFYSTFSLLNDKSPMIK